MEAKFSVQTAQGERETYSHLRQKDSGISPSLSASARTLSISELRWKIFQLVDWEPSRKKTLLALALTCESFTGPALDLLWQNLDGLGPLVRCLPQSLWKLDKQELEFQRAMTFDDWSIFCKYSHRIRSLHMRWSSYRVGTEIWGALGCPPFSLPLLPNLTSLTWHARSEAFPCIRLFLTQKLTTLNINAYYPELKFSPSVQSILSCIPMLCPSVSHFDLQGRSGSGDTSIGLQCWSHLVSVKPGKISDAALLHLSNLPSLRELYLKLHLTPIAADTQKLLQYPAFSALHKLDITCESLAPLDAFFETLSIAPEILFVTIIFIAGEDSALPASISRISNACTYNALKHLRIIVDGMDGDSNTSVSAAVFQPLYAFRNLRELNFKVEYDVQLDDATLLQMAKAWPLLEELVIRGEYSASTPHNITPNAFVSLLQHCPRLTSIGIALDWSDVDRRDISSEIPYQGFSHNALSEADFGSSRIRHVTGVAAFLSAIAPKLEYVVGWDSDFHYDHEDCEKYSLRWKAVHHWVEALRMVREQERKRIVLSAGGDVVGDISGGGDDSEDGSGSESGSNQVSSDSGEEE
ncbi:hypothetical protein K503DRAFT_866266 [Rhizopogon vinicolor AM-OR11-026]|uniref:F-box domain-containing protein n=1 Tax=Rhizopogon vinicolor AM-OR11-026 TaxID=1314800 RepID=A0A1B7N085_9AGAM|nr:hypothetical protein K503DRAFT_866266 [Rhizopogon vinicolor AM-OR11-026]